MTYRARSLVAAIGLAVLAMLLVGFYVSSYKRNVTHTQEHVSVWVASKDIPAGTTGADLAGGSLLTSKEVLRDSVVPGAIAEPKQLHDLVASETTYAGEQVTVSRFSSQAEIGVRSLMRGPQRAIQIAGDANQTLLGTLRAGDYVDVVSNVHGSSGGAAVDRVVLRNLRVLRVSVTTGVEGKLAASSGAGATNPVQLLVTDKQVQKLWYAVKNDDWTLELRPVAKATDSREKVETPIRHIMDNLPANEVSAVNAVAK
jgi:Flp pilus assembly protein CpaB